MFKCSGLKGLSLSALSINILHPGYKSPMKRGFFKNSTGNLLTNHRFLVSLYDFCNFIIIFSLMQVTMICTVRRNRFIFKKKGHIFFIFNESRTHLFHFRGTYFFLATVILMHKMPKTGSAYKNKQVHINLTKIISLFFSHSIISC